MKAAVLPAAELLVGRRLLAVSQLADHPDAANRYTQERRAARQAWELQREAEHQQAARNQARPTAFDSLRPGPVLNNDPRARRFLATSVTNRLDRFRDPETNGVDASDRQDLLKQAAVLGISEAEATTIINTVEAAYQRLPRVSAVVETETPRWFRRRATRMVAKVVVAGLLLAAVQAAVLVAWAWLVA